MPRIVDLKDKILVEITIIQRSISFFSNHSEHHAWCVSALQHEQNKLEQMKQQYPEYFI